MPEKLLPRLLEVLQNSIMPLTQKKVLAGNKIFGAAILKKVDYSLVIAASNEELKNPLFHGEISCLNQYWRLKKKPNPKECIFFSTHEPCSMCLSAITWSGFDNFYYFFDYENSKKDFYIPHDLKILAEVFGCANGSYRKKNHYWESHHLIKMVDKLSEPQKSASLKKITQIQQDYQKFSEIYQTQKNKNSIPLN